MGGPAIPKMFGKGYVAQVFFVNESVIRKLKSYAIETKQSIHELTAPEFKAFEQALMNKALEIDKIRLKEYEEAIKEREVRQLSEQNPLKVTGKQEDPIGPSEPIAVEQRVF